jgi:hypothetical protein
MKYVRLSHIFCVVAGATLGVAASVGAASIAGSSVFRDVPAGSYYDNAIGAMFQSGIIKGYADGRFGPDEYVTRGQLAVMFERLRADLTGQVVDQSTSTRSRSSRSTSSASSESSVTSSSSSSSVTSFSNSLNPYGTIRFTAPVYTVNEKDGNATISVVRTGGNQGTVSIEYALEAGTATTDDFEIATASLTFQGKATSTTFTVKIKDDALTEGTETLKIVLRNPTNNATLGSPAVAELKIIDDETVTVSSAASSSSSVAPSVGFGATEYSIADAGGSLTVTLVRAGGTAGAVTVQYATADGTARSGTDYTSTSGTVSFASGEATKTFAVPVIANSSITGNKNFKVVLSNPTGGVTLVPGTANVVIHDDEVSPFGSGSLKFAKSVYDGFESQGKVEIAVQRTGGSRGKVTVRYATSNGTAAAGRDYTATSGTLTFEAGESIKTFIVPITYDTESDGEETVNLMLSAPTGGADLITPSTATLRIY